MPGFNISGMISGSMPIDTSMFQALHINIFNALDEQEELVLEWGLLTSYETGPFWLILIIFNIAQGFLGGSKPQTHCNRSKVKLGVRKPWVAEHRNVEARFL